MIKIRSLVFGLTALLGFNAFAGNHSTHAVRAEDPGLTLSAKHYVPDKYDFIDYYGTVGDVDAEQGGGITTFAHMAGQVPLKGDAIKLRSTLKLLSAKDVAEGGDGVDGWITYSFSAVPGGDKDNSFPYFGGSGSGVFLMIKNVSGTMAPNTVDAALFVFDEGADTHLGSTFIDNIVTNTGVLANDPIAFDLQLFKDGATYKLLITDAITGDTRLEFPGIPLNESLFINDKGQTFFSSAIYEGPGCDGDHHLHRGNMIHSFDAYTYDADDAVVTLDPDSVVYDGVSHRPDVTVKIGDLELEEDLDYFVEVNAITDVGVSTATVNFIGDFAGNAPVDKEFRIMPLDASEAVVTLAEDEYEHTGEAIEPVVSSVKLGEKELVVDVDYTVSYTDNTAVGTGKVVVTYKGNYTGVTEKTFTIAAAAVDPGTSEPPTSEPPASETPTSGEEPPAPSTGCFGNVAATLSMSLALAGLVTFLVIKRKRLV